MAKKITEDVLFLSQLCVTVEHQLYLLRSKPKTDKLFCLPTAFQNLGAGKFQGLSREMDRAELEEKAAGYLPQSLFLPGNLLNAGICLLEASNDIVCEDYSQSTHWEKIGFLSLY